MTINENLLKYIFSVRNIVKHGLLLIITLLAVTFIIVLCITAMYNKVYTNYQNLIKINTVNTLTLDFPHRVLYNCKLINCKSIIIYSDNKYHKYNLKINKDNSDSFEYIGDITIFYNWFSNKFDQDFNLIIKSQNYNELWYIINDNFLIIELFFTTIYLYIFLIIAFIILSIYNVYLSYKNLIYEKGSYRLYSESKIQGNISEMLHHEISAPIAVLKSVTTEIKETYSNNENKELSKLLDGMTYSTDRLEAILNLLYDNKAIKNNDENNTLYSLLHYVTNTINKVNVRKITCEFEDERSFDKLNVSPKLGSGNFLNILQVMLNNSIEAGANKILFYLKNTNNKYTCLYIKDNGHGIRDKNNKLFKNSGKVLATYGYSSKDKQGNHMKTDNLLYKILSFLGIRVISTNPNRGIGLHVNKILLEKVGGTIKLVETSENGTTFKIKIPIIPSK